MNQDRNRLRAFTDVVSVDAWHQPFDGERQQVDLKVDVVFSEARVGGEPESPVQFRLRLKRATLVVIMPESEPVAAVRDSIRREENPTLVDWTNEIVSTSKLSGDANASVGASLRDLSASAAVSVSGSGEVASIHKQKSTGKSAPIKTMFRFDNSEQTYTWTFECETAEFLVGRAWDANASPVMRLKDLRQRGVRGIAPSVRVAIKCLREDLLITDIRLKDDDLSLAEKLLGKEQKTKKRAAEAYIRTKLMETGLDVGDISNEFASIVMLEVTAKSDG